MSTIVNVCCNRAGLRYHPGSSLAICCWRLRGEGPRVKQQPRSKIEPASRTVVRREAAGARDRRVTYIETSRGCPFSCQFCLSSIEVGVRYFDREKIKKDIRYLMENGAKTIKFVDRTFNISRSYAMEMFRFIIDEHLLALCFNLKSPQTLCVRR